MKNKLTIIFGILAVGLILVSGTSAQSRFKRPVTKRPAAVKPRPAALPLAVKTASGLTYFITQNGTGRTPKVGETVVVHYTGTLTNGTKFDSSRDRGQPISFPLGQGKVIKGWDEGIAKLRVGDQAIFVIPPAIAYGPKGRGPIPPDATLIFIVELVNIEEK